jgi:NAD(P)H dehydrogenase (quinone)
MLVVTGASGHLGRRTVEELLHTVPAEQVVAAVGTPAKAAALAARGVQVREADYDRPDTLRAAFEGAQRALLGSGTEVGRRVAQHRAVVDAARQAGARLLAYTSVLHCDATPLPWHPSTGLPRTTSVPVAWRSASCGTAGTTRTTWTSRDRPYGPE